MSGLQGMFRRTVLALIAVLLGWQIGLAQSDRATVSGTVSDTSGAAISGATVTLMNVNTNASREATTGKDGSYVFPAVQVGTYKITVKADGFQTTSTEDIILQVGDSRSVNIEITPGAVTDVVTVTADAPLVKTESSELGEVIETRKILDLPLNGRNYTQLATLVPGVVRPAGIGGGNALISGGTGGASGQGAPGPRTEGARFDASGGSDIVSNGQRPAFNNFLVDGVDNNEPLFGQIAVYSNPDAIGEFKVITGTPAAEYGRAGGAVISSSFKSGTNELHGTVYYFHRNSALNARDFGNRAPAPKAPFKNHEFGFSIGGPIIKDKTFFFGDYAGQRNNRPESGVTSVPTAKSRVGDFSDFAAAGFGVPIDPRTGRPFPNNVIPTDRILAGGGQAALNVLKTYDLPNQAGVVNNFAFTRDILEKIDSFDIRIDHSFNSYNKLFGRYTFADQTRTRDSIFKLAPAGFGNGIENGNTRQVVVGDTHIFSPTLINDFRFGYSSIDISILNGGVGGTLGISPTYAADAGIPNVNDGRLETSGAPGLGFNSGVGGIEFIGDGGPFTVPAKSIYIGDSVTFIRGRHTFRAGGSIVHRRSKQFDGGRAGGVKGFFGIGDGETGNTQASILLGVGQAFMQRGFVNGPFLQTFNEIGLFIQDDFRVNDRLTLNFGLRYDYFANPTEDQDRQGNFDIATRTIRVANVDGSRSLIEPDRNNFGPRFGFAYALNEKKNLVLRGGYGLLYAQESTGIPNLTQNPPASQPTQFFPAVLPNGSRINLRTGFPTLTNVIDPKRLDPNSVYVYIDPNRRTPYIQQYHLSLQYEFIKNYVLNVGYVGNRATKLLASRQLGSAANGFNMFQANGQFGQFGNVQALENRAYSNYNGLQVSLNKRFSDGLSFLISYAYSKALDNSSGPDTRFQNSGGGNLNGPQDPLNMDAEYGHSSFDIRHIFSSSVVYDLPFGQGRAINLEGVADKIFGGFQLNLITSVRSGVPFNITTNENGVRPNVSGNPEGSGDFGFNLSAFSAPSTVFRNGRNIRIGSAARNLLHGPEFSSFDLSVLKNIPITSISESFRLQLRFEFFNIFNRTNLGTPNANLNFDSRGRVIDDGSVGRSTFALPKRQIQIAAKIIF